jgi:hypothetical protein
MVRTFRDVYFDVTDEIAFIPKDISTTGTC